MATNEDEPQLRRLSSVVDRLATTQVERIVSEVFKDVRDRAQHVVRGMLLEELVRRLIDEDPAGAVPEQVVERPTSLASVQEELAGLEKELDQLVATTGEEIPEGSSLYLYAVVPSADARRALMPEGVVPGRTVEAIEDGELAAVVSRVDASKISADAADADAIAGIARRHDDVLTALAQQATVIPFRLGTVCRSPADVHRLLTSERDRLYDLVNELYDRDEFGVQVVVAEGEAEPTAPADTDEAGVTYLQRKVDQRRESEWQWQAARRAAEAIHERLAGLAVRWHAVPSSSGRPDLVSNGSYLVERRRADEFLSEADGLRAEHAESGVSIRVTGPWPPYSFTELDANGLEG